MTNWAKIFTEVMPGLGHTAGRVLHRGNKGDCLHAPGHCIGALEVYIFLIRFPLPRRKCLGALALSKTYRPAPYDMYMYENTSGNGMYASVWKGNCIFSLVKGTLWGNCKFWLSFQGHQGNDQGAWRQQPLLPPWSIEPSLWQLLNLDS